MAEAVRVIEMKVGQDDGCDVLDGDVEGGKLAVDLLVAGDGEFELGAIEPGRDEAIRAKVSGAGDGGAFTGVDDKDPFGVFDD